MQRCENTFAFWVLSIFLTTKKKKKFQQSAPDFYSLVANDCQNRLCKSALSLRCNSTCTSNHTSFQSNQAKKAHNDGNKSGSFSRKRQINGGYYLGVSVTAITVLCGKASCDFLSSSWRKGRRKDFFAIRKTFTELTCSAKEVVHPLFFFLSLHKKTDRAVQVCTAVLAGDLTGPRLSCTRVIGWGGTWHTSILLPRMGDVQQSNKGSRSSKRSTNNFSVRFQQHFFFYFVTK